MDIREVVVNQAITQRRWLVMVSWYDSHCEMGMCVSFWRRQKVQWLNLVSEAFNDVVTTKLHFKTYSESWREWGEEQREDVSRLWSKRCREPFWREVVRVVVTACDKMGMGVAMGAGWDLRLEPNVISINRPITSYKRRRQWFLTRMPWTDVKLLGGTEPLCRGCIILWNMDGSSLQLNSSKGLVGFLRHWMVSMHDDLRRTGHWLKASAWRWLCELSTSSSLLLVQSEGCICLYHMWLCPSCTVQSVFMTRWYDFDIACTILLVGSCRVESLFTCYIITLAAFGVLYRNSCQKIRKI